ncbi:hypothetical protein BYT27DRAFT_7182180 [Phlegmacium glaucopus]|nr:hypothetical protein BYT27DRAFT_7182180 [Phlegmacium glaucopus]
MSVILQRISIDSTFGACLIGAQISAMLYGLTTLQSYFFLVFYPEDSRENKALVCIIWLLDSLHTAFVSITIYHYLVTNYDNPPSLAIGHWSLFMSIAVNIVTACIVQTFFATRIFRLTSSTLRWWLTSIIGISVLAHFCFGMETFILMFIKREFARLSEITLFSATPFAIFAVLSDVLIAGSLCVLLHGSRTGYRKTNTIISSLIVYAINRCLLTSVVAIVEVIVFSIMPKSLWFLAIDFVIGKLYANSLLATLNSRQSIRATSTSAINSTRMTDIAFVEPTESTATTGRPMQKADTRAIVIDVHAESTQRSNDSQSHISTQEKKSTLAPYNVTHDSHDPALV